MATAATIAYCILGRPVRNNTIQPAAAKRLAIRTDAARRSVAIDGYGDSHSAEFGRDLFLPIPSACQPTAFGWHHRCVP